MEILFRCFYSVTIRVLTLKMLGFDSTSCLLFYSKIIKTLKVRLTSLLSQRSVLGPLLSSLAYLKPTIILFANDCIIDRKIMIDSYIDTLQIDLDRRGEWTIENGMKIIPGKSKTVSFARHW